MVAVHDNALDQALDIAGSLTQSASLVLSEESLQLGSRIAGQTGAAASITVFAAGIVTITGLTGMAVTSLDRFITVSGAATAANNGTFLIVEFTSAASVKYSNVGGVAPDANNGAISWIERNPYSLEDDLNYVRTDRAAIKGTVFNGPIPTYFRCTDVTTAIPANLTNIAGNTTDAISFVTNRKFENVAVLLGDGYVTIFSAGMLPYADAINRTGVPIFDGADAGNHEATYVDVIADGYGKSLFVLGGPNQGFRIFGRTRAGTTGVDGDSVEIEFRSVAIDSPISTSVAYTWEANQPTVIDVYYGFRQCLNAISENAFRVMMVNGLISDAGALTPFDHENLDTLVHNISENAFFEIVRDVNGRVSSATYYTDSTKTIKVREALLTRDVQTRVAVIDEKQYDGAGALKVELVQTLTRNLQGRVVSITLNETEF